ncbi:MAG: hypothetical protein ACPHN2_03585 [Sinimarinibacterium flocculans]|uniref:hypothetical protein n=1 Tax=Sinimarinibacterium flocculans TaxID=985250 RepID=UPI003C338A65
MNFLGIGLEKYCQAASKRKKYAACAIKGRMVAPMFCRLVTGFSPIIGHKKGELALA